MPGLLLLLLRLQPMAAKPSLSTLTAQATSMSTAMATSVTRKTVSLTLTLIL